MQVQTLCQCEVVGSLTQQQHFRYQTLELLAKVSITCGLWTVRPLMIGLRWCDVSGAEVIRFIGSCLKRINMRQGQVWGVSSYKPHHFHLTMTLMHVKIASHDIRRSKIWKHSRWKTVWGRDSLLILASYDWPNYACWQCEIMSTYVLIFHEIHYASIMKCQTWSNDPATFMQCLYKKPLTAWQQRQWYQQRTRSYRPCFGQRHQCT